MDEVEINVKDLEKVDSRTVTENNEDHTLSTREGEEAVDGWTSARCPNLSDRICVVVFALLGFALYSYDVFSDVLLTVAYSQEANHTLEFTLTATYTVAPAVLCNILCAYYLYIEAGTFTWNVILAFPFMLGSVVRYVKAIVFGCRNKDTRKLDNNTAIVSLIEAYVESSSQLILQSYFLISLTSDHTEELTTRLIRYASMSASAASLAWALVAIRRTNRFQDDNKKNDETKLGSICNFLARISEIVPRLIVITLFTSQYHVFTFVFGGVHYVICLLWILFIDKTDVNCKPISIFLKITISYVLIFCFVDLDYLYTRRSREHIPTRFKMGMYYFLFYIENWVKFTMWYKEADSTVWYYTPSIVVMICCMIFHILFLITYYKLCHPKRGLLRRWNEYEVDWFFYYSEHPSSKYTKAEEST